MSKWAKLSLWCGTLADFALPVVLTTAFFLTAFGIVSIPGSVTELFGPNFSVVWAQLLFWANLSITCGLLSQIFRPLTNLYIWFEYPGFIVGAILALVYVGALIIRFGLFSPSIIAIAFAAGIGLRFLFRFGEIHFKFTDVVKTRLQ